MPRCVGEWRDTIAHGLTSTRLRRVVRRSAGNHDRAAIVYVQSLRPKVFGCTLAGLTAQRPVISLPPTFLICARKDTRLRNSPILAAPALFRPSSSYLFLGPRGGTVGLSARGDSEGLRTPLTISGQSFGAFALALPAWPVSRQPRARDRQPGRVRSGAIVLFSPMRGAGRPGSHSTPRWRRSPGRPSRTASRDEDVTDAGAKRSVRPLRRLGLA
jgi:hypothetical protein